jgi:hypothetical protein
MKTYVGFTAVTLIGSLLLGACANKEKSEDKQERKDTTAVSSLTDPSPQSAPMSNLTEPPSQSTQMAADTVAFRKFIELFEYSENKIPFDVLTALSINTEDMDSYDGYVKTLEILRNDSIIFVLFEHVRGGEKLYSATFSQNGTLIE